ncbi:uncharacterized protein LOC106871568 [Octopus bimaculoides]|uniref:uncharacterized protein LOC106871568 n=1 Tax=Octopus bimaculoides TaxID=37653 RepID=UPI0022E28E08|nr:uncharacterized protein LOC106871568 [Octopus bimaculoides]
MDSRLEGKTFAEATEIRKKEVNVTNLRKFENMVDRDGGDVKLSPSVEKMVRVTVYKVYSVEEKIILESTEVIERALRPIWRDITYLARGGRFETVERSISKSIEKTKEHSVTHLKMDKVVLLPMYSGRTARVKVEGIPPEIDVAWVAAEVLLGSEEQVTVIQATETEATNWQGEENGDEKLCYSSWRTECRGSTCAGATLSGLQRSFKKY